MTGTCNFNEEVESRIKKNLLGIRAFLHHRVGRWVEDITIKAHEKEKKHIGIRKTENETVMSKATLL